MYGRMFYPIAEECRVLWLSQSWIPEGGRRGVLLLIRAQGPVSTATSEPQRELAIAYPSAPAFTWLPCSVLPGDGETSWGTVGSSHVSVNAITQQIAVSHWKSLSTTSRRWLHHTHTHTQNMQKQTGCPKKLSNCFLYYVTKKYILTFKMSHSVSAIIWGEK